MRPPLHFLNISHRHENGKVVKQKLPAPMTQGLKLQFTRQKKRVEPYMSPTVIARMRCMDRTFVHLHCVQLVSVCRTRAIAYSFERSSGN